MSKNRSRVLTDAIIEKLPIPKSGQALHFDKAQKGLAVLVGATGTKSFRSYFQLHGKWVTRSIGRFGEITDDLCADAQVRAARERVRLDRIAGAEGRDPRHVEPAPVVLTFDALVTEFVERHCRVRQRTAIQTERLLRNHCHAWMKRPVDTITQSDVQALLDKIVKRGNGPTATHLLIWLRTMWTWADKRRLVADGNIMRRVDLLHYEKGVRDRVWSADEIGAIWHAAEHLSDVERVYIRMLLLTAARRSALANMRWQDLDDPETPTLWITPVEFVKQPKLAKPRTYTTPLTALAQLVLATLPRKHPTLCLPSPKRTGAIHPGSPLVNKMVKHGAPKDFGYHQARHTIASHFSDASDWEIGLLLNHSQQATVTSGYRHGHRGLGLKTSLLEEWSVYVAACAGLNVLPLQEAAE